MLRYRLRTLLIVLALGPPVLAVAILPLVERRPQPQPLAMLRYLPQTGRG